MGLILFLLAFAFVASFVVAVSTNTADVRELAFVVAKMAGFLLICWTVLLVFSQLV